jgi:hypothetical protein
MLSDLQALELTIALANAQLARQLKQAEALLNRLGADAEAALGPGGYARRMFEEDRDQQIAMAEKMFLPVTLH